MECIQHVSEPSLSHGGIGKLLPKFVKRAVVNFERGSVCLMVPMSELHQTPPADDQCGALSWTAPPAGRSQFHCERREDILCIVIIGGLLGGLTAAALLRDAGHDVDI